MGLTRQRIHELRNQNYEKERKYKAVMKDRWVKEERAWLERAKAMEMLLGAEYNRTANVFIKAGTQDSPGDRVWDCKGVELMDDWDIRSQVFRRPW
ncbi:hypothetical protein EVB41_023 [Rhizobium phage RHph_TM3_14A]|nr:hypothetical protein EVB29_023 [Rhizobium phage RHph_TM27A]QIG66943.1 hypothetical protein EVB30_023 [Rhizobium phage RHph_TM27B]QIG67488.1 hypothetical protein EVB41_023 [Rhizobium phage RHph_TM3_14A]